MKTSNKKIKKQNEFTARDVAAKFKDGMKWESDHFGYCTMNCYHGIGCPAIFHFDGGLRVICINKYCTHPERRYSIPASVFQKTADRWNEDKKKAISVF